MRLSITILFFSFLTYNSLAQLVDPNKKEYTKELTFGINTNTNSGLIGGINLRYAKQIDDKNWFSGAIEIVAIKHKKEIKVSSSAGGNSFVAGKLNHLFSIRPTLSYEHRLFKKDKMNGVRVHGVIGGGPSIGLSKPYYVEVIKTETIRIDNRDTTISYTETIPYTPTQDPTQIVGAGGFFKGFNEFKAIFGFNIKAAINLEFGMFDSKATGLEIGWILEGFTKDPRVYNVNQQQQLWSSVFLTIYFGSKY